MIKLAIQFRNGNEADLDKSQLLIGEPVYCSDSKKAFLGDGAGGAMPMGDMFSDDYANGSGQANANKTDHSIYSDGSGSATTAAAAAAGSLLAKGWTLISQILTFLSSANAPTFTATTSVDLTPFISVPMKIMLTNTTVKYFIVTDITPTTITLYGGTNYGLTNVAISAVYYSVQKSPFGFPLDKTKWQIISKITTNIIQNPPVQYQWYNFASFIIPIGAWRVYHDSFMSPYRTANGDLSQRVTLSTTMTTETDLDFSAVIQSDNVMNLQGSVHREKNLLLAAETNYYLNSLTSTGGIGGIRMMHATFGTETIICAECAYL
jgi:hypothetical protein